MCYAWFRWRNTFQWPTLSLRWFPCGMCASFFVRDLVHRVTDISISSNAMEQPSCRRCATRARDTSTRHDFLREFAFRGAFGILRVASNQQHSFWQSQPKRKILAISRGRSKECLIVSSREEDAHAFADFRDIVLDDVMLHLDKNRSGDPLVVMEVRHRFILDWGVV